MENIKRKYALISLIDGFILGILFIILFAWKHVGISFPIFAFAFSISSLLPVIIVEGKEGMKRINISYIFHILFLSTFNNKNPSNLISQQWTDSWLFNNGKIPDEIGPAIYNKDIFQPQGHFYSAH